MHRSMMNIRKLSLEEEDELSKRIDLLLKDGKQIEGTSPTVDIHSRPDYLDDTRFDAAQKVINRYYVSVSMASSMGLMLLLQLEEILMPLLRTGKSRTVPDLYDRYSATIKYIRKCYESRFYDSTSEAWKYISIVRSMHQRIFKLMNAQTDSGHDSDSGKYLWVNQYDMAVTQFAFVGMFILRPDKCGAPNLTEQELSDITYFWRVLSYYFGIEDRFNLFIYHDDVAKQIRLIEIIFEQYKQKLNEPRNPVGVGMAEGIMLAFEELSTDATFNILDHHWHDTVSLSGRPQLLPYTGLAELWKLARFKAVLKLIANSDMVRNMINQIYKKRTDKFCNNGERIKKRLIKKYPKHIFESNDANMISGSVRE